MKNLYQPFLICPLTMFAGITMYANERQRVSGHEPQVSHSGHPGAGAAQVMTGRFGIGVSLQSHENPNAVVIVNVRPGGPAEQAGLRKDDEIVAVDGKPVANLTTSDVASLLTSTHEVPARLRIRRGTDEFEVTVQRSPMERIFNLPPRGKPAPSFVLPDTNGKSVSLGEFKGKPVIVTFWATWCGPCVAESDELNKLARKFEHQFVILGLDVNDEPDALQQFLRKRPLSYPVLKAGKIDGPVATSYGVTGLPLTVIITADGLVDFVLAGGATEDTLETHVRSAMSH